MIIQLWFHVGYYPVVILLLYDAYLPFFLHYPCIILALLPDYF